MKLTRQNILDLNPCREGLVFARSHDFDAVKIYHTCPRGDWLIWLLRRTNTITKPQAVLLAVTCAEHVLEIFEKKYPGEKRPRLAIDSVKNWLANPTEENRKTCRIAADAAAYAAADAAYTAASAAYTAASAAYAAAAYTAAAAAYAADDAARTEEYQWQANKIREIVPCPFEN